MTIIWSDMESFPKSGRPVLSDQFGNVVIGTTNDMPNPPSANKVEITGATKVTWNFTATGSLTGAGVAAGGAISGATTIAASGATTCTLATTGGLYSAGFATVAPASTALIPVQNSPAVVLGNNTWNGSVVKLGGMDMALVGYTHAGSPVSSRLVIKNNTVDGTAETSELVTVDDTGKLTVLGTSLGSEVLQDSTLDTAPTTNWTVTGDWGYTTNDYTFTRSTGSGTLSQASARYLTPINANRWYCLTYVVGVTWPAGTVCWLGTEVADRRISMPVLGAATYRVFFRSAATPGNFTINTTASTTSGLRLDSISLKEVIGGNVEASGLFTGGGSLWIKVTGDGRTAIGTTTFDSTNPEMFKVDAGTTTSVNVTKLTGSINSYLQENIQNTSSGASASTDVVCTNNTGTETTNFIDMGINSSAWSDANWTISGATDWYVYTKSGALSLGTADAKDIIIHTGGLLAANERLRVLSTGEIQLSENSVRLDAALSADGKWCGITETGTAGATLAFGDLCYLQASDSRWELADANLSAGYDKKLGMCVVAAAWDGSATEMLLIGKIRADAKFPTLTIGSPAYMSETAGLIVTTQPSTADACIRVVGYGNTADELYFNPSSDYIIHA